MSRNDNFNAAMNAIDEAFKAEKERNDEIWRGYEERISSLKEAMFAAVLLINDGKAEEAGNQLFKAAING